MRDRRAGELERPDQRRARHRARAVARLLVGPRLARALPGDRGRAGEAGVEGESGALRFHSPVATTIETLGLKDADSLRALLAKDPVQNLYLLGLFEEFGIVPRPGRAPFAFWGRFNGRDLTAAVFVGGEGGLVVPSAHDAGDLGEIAQALAAKVRLRSAIGDKAAVDALVRHL